MLTEISNAKQKEREVEGGIAGKDWAKLSHKEGQQKGTGYRSQNVQSAFRDYIKNSTTI